MKEHTKASRNWRRYMKPGNSQSIRKLRQNLEEWVMSAEEDETCEILDALLSYCDDMDHNYDYETANDKRARSVAVSVKTVGGLSG